MKKINLFISVFVFAFIFNFYNANASAVMDTTCYAIAKVVDTGSEIKKATLNNPKYELFYFNIKILGLEDNNKNNLNNNCPIKVGDIFKIENNSFKILKNGDEIKVGVQSGSSNTASGIVGYLQWTEATYKNGKVIPYRDDYATDFQSDKKPISIGDINNIKKENNNLACVLFSKALKYGDGYKNGKGKEVKDLQEKLREKGYLNASSTGHYGFLTREAVKKYQRDNGILATGNIFERTLGQLKKHFCGAGNSDNNNNASTSPITNNCKVWFDGCNNCSKSTISGAAACTMMYCDKNGEVFCKEYFSN